MRCAELMSVDLRVLPETASVQQAAVVMRDNSLGFLPVCDEAGHPVGVVTDRDVAVRAAASDRIASLTAVVEVMSGPAIVCDEHEDLGAAEQRMIEEGVARLVVVDGEGVAVGILSLTDLLEREPKGRAVKVARGVLAREAQGPHFPVEQIRLTPGALPEAAVDHEGARRGGAFESVIMGGSATREM